MILRGKLVGALCVAVLATLVMYSSRVLEYAAPPALSADCSVNFNQGPGGYYRKDDRSGPYVVNSNCVASLLGDTVVQSPAVYKGGVIATGGASQPWLDNNPARRGFTIQNQSTGDLYFKIGGAAATQDRFSFRLAPGQLYETESKHVSTGAVSIVGGTAGQGWYATEF